MSLLEPLSLAWLGLLVPLVLLYVLKRRREERVIGSTLLWSLAQRDLRAERPWQRLIPHLSLLLQILALIAGAFALSRPAGAGHLPSGARVVVVIDTSASMAARDEEGVRFERARSELRNLARSLPLGGELSIVEGAGEPSVLLPPTGDLARLEAAIDGLSVGGGTAALELAVAVASERLATAPSGSRIVVLTDAATSGTLTLPATVPVEVSRIGAPELGARFNDAIVALDVRAHPSDSAPDRTEIFARVERFGGTEGDVFVSAEVGEEIIASRRVRLTPGTASGVLLTADLPPDPEGRAPIVLVRVRRDEDGEGETDALSEDDLAVAPSPGARRISVFLVGEVPESVRRVLLTDGGAELFQTSVDALAAREEETELEGAYVFAGATPAAPPGGEVLVVNPSSPLFGMELPEAVTSPRVITWDESDPRLRFTTFGSVHIGSLRPLNLTSYEPLVTSEAGPAIASLERPDGSVTVVGFDPDHSDWPRQAGFVIFFRNLLESARARRAAGGIAPGRIGDALRIPAPDGTEVTVTAPDGSEQRGVSRGGIAIVPVPAIPGRFAVRAGATERFALRNLLDAEESDLSPRAELVVTNGATTGEVSEAREPLEAWPYVAGFLLFVLAIEALWATRKGAPA
jgi:Ca-activated chloride channel family protein